MNDMIIWSPGTTLEALERLAILRAFKHFRNNKVATAVSLGIAVRTLDAKLEKYDRERLAQQATEREERLVRENFLARSRGQIPPPAPMPAPAPAPPPPAVAIPAAEPAPVAATPVTVTVRKAK